MAGGGTGGAPLFVKMPPPLPAQYATANAHRAAQARNARRSSTGSNRIGSCQFAILLPMLVAITRQI
jgi:hypothetical protein